ncbi:MULTISPECIES: hypothetical protein [Rhizobium/Agrobacterium group]|nr:MULTISPECIES: hypothetical protein [Rhizobium/Agrobacterium group]
MDSKFGDRIMIAVLAIGFFICTAYELTSDHRNKNNPPEVAHSQTQP